MATVLVVRHEWGVDGVLTDPTAIVLSDSTAAYGIRKTGGANVLAAGTAMVKISTGVYQYEFTEADGATYSQAYTSWVKVTYSGVDYYFDEDHNAVAESASLSVTALKVLVADFLGWGRNSEGVGSDWSTEEINRLTGIVEAGVRRVFFPVVGGRSREWSFLRLDETLTTSLPYSTGTVSSSGTTVTLSGGTFPTWATYGDLLVDGEHYAVATRTDSTHVELEREPSTAFAADSYSIERYVYDLPTDFGGLHGKMVYHPDHAEGYRPLKRVSVQRLRELRRACDETDYPQYVAIRPVTFATTTGQRHEALLNPTPAAAVVLDYQYKVQPTITVGSDTYFRGGELVWSAIEESCLAIAEQRFKQEGSGEHGDLFREALAAAIEADVEMSALPGLGRDRGGELSGGSQRRLLVPTVMFDGVEV